MILFKNIRIANEWQSNLLDKRLKKIVEMVSNYVEVVYKINITITEINRYPSEQREYYKNDTKFKKKPWDSVHQYWRGVDIRTNDMTAKQISEIIELLDKVPYDDTHKTCKYHDVGQGMHLHIQSPDKIKGENKWKI